VCIALNICFRIVCRRQTKFQDETHPWHTCANSFVYLLGLVVYKNNFYCSDNGNIRIFAFQLTHRFSTFVEAGNPYIKLVTSHPLVWKKRRNHKNCVFAESSFPKLLPVIHTDSIKENSIVLLNFHTLLLMTNKHSVFCCNLTELAAHTLARNNWRATRKSFEEFKRFRYLFFKWSGEYNTDTHKYVNAKGTRIFVLNFW